ncbi:MAG: hypothetical protein ACK4OF_04395 [Aquificaceae bacterium]
MIKGIKEDNVDKVFEALTNAGISPIPLYKSLSEGLEEATVECSKEQVLELKNSLLGICQVIPLEEKATNIPTLALLSLFLDNLLLFYILKLSLYSEDFRSFFRYSLSLKVQNYLQSLLSLVLIVGYYYTFITTKGAPPIAKWLQIEYQKDKGLIILAYSLPLIGLYLISTGFSLSKFLGLAMVSLSVGLIAYSNVKFS